MVQMFNLRLIRPTDVEFHVEVLAFLIQTNGLPTRPSLPIEQRMSKGFETLAYKDGDTRSVFDWAEDSFGTLIAACQMEEFSLCLVANDGGLDANQIAAQRRLDVLAAGQNPYYRPSMTPILYDPRNATEPGHFSATTLLQLGELRAAGFKSRTPLSPLQTRMVTIIAAVYNGQGFVLAHLLRQVSAYLTPQSNRRAVPHKTIIEALCFSTCLALRARGETQAQIMENYGPTMPKLFRRQIRKACRQINRRGEALETLQKITSDEPQIGSLRHRAKHIA